LVTKLGNEANAVQRSKIKNRPLPGLLVSAGGGTRTPDTRIMIPLL
jgi:hypothetical protein